MMKKSFIIFIFLVLIFSGKVYAQENLITPSISATPKPTPTIIDYAFPYPGMLPGNFLYNLKALRDRILETLISDPAKKSSFYLLQADKRFSASLMLFDQGKNELAESTLSKGQNYLEKAIDKAEEVGSLKGRFGEANDRIKLSSAKQAEEIKKLIDKTTGEINKKLVGELKRAEELQKRAEKLK